MPLAPNLLNLREKITQSRLSQWEVTWIQLQLEENLMAL
jgi:hypothetical protein